MAEESKVVGTGEVPVETTDRGLFDFMGKKEEKPQEEVIAVELKKVHVSEPVEAHKVEEVYKVEEVPKVEEEKKEGLLAKLHRTSSSSSSSSSDEEEVGEDGEKKKKKKKGVTEKLKEKISGVEKFEEHDTSVPIEKCEEVVTEPAAPEEKKGFMEKIKEKLPGQQKKTEEVPPVVAAPVVAEEGEEKPEKKGIMEKIKEKLPGYHPKTEEEKEKH